MKDTFSINVKIGDRTYAMTIERKDEERVRKAAKAGSEKYSKYIMRKGFEPIDCYALIALETSMANIQKEEEKSSSNVINQLKEIDSTLEDCLKD